MQKKNSNNKKFGKSYLFYNFEVIGLNLVFKFVVLSKVI